MKINPMKSIGIFFIVMFLAFNIQDFNTALLNISQFDYEDVRILKIGLAILAYGFLWTSIATKIGGMNE